MLFAYLFTDLPSPIVTERDNKILKIDLGLSHLQHLDVSKEGSSPPLSREFHLTACEVRQKGQKVCSDEQGAPSQSWTYKGQHTEGRSKNGYHEKNTEILSEHPGMKLEKLKTK